MAVNATFAQRIEELIGSDYTTIAANSYVDLFNAAIAEVADMLPTELLLKYAIGPILLDGNTPTWANVEGDKVLLATREEGDGGPHRECTQVSIQDFERTKDINSIYLATAHSPVFAFTTTGGNTSLTLYPAPTSTEGAKIYYFHYPSTDNTGATSLTGFPNEVEQAVVLKACINILQTYVSDFVQDDEDQELQTMITTQMQALNNMYTSEMSRYMEQDATPRGE